MAQELADALKFNEVRFIPSANPPHKAEPEISAAHRTEMVQLAIADNPIFKLDARELAREGASYMIDTLISLRDELGESCALCLIMGSDAFTKLDTWHRWDELLNYCHIILVQRPNTEVQPKLSVALTALLHDCYTEDLSDLATKNAGFIHMQKISAQDISATKIRQKLTERGNVNYLLPVNVLAYIQQHNLYLQHE